MTNSNVKYHIASFVSGQDEANPAMRLATRADKMAPSLGITPCVPQEKIFAEAEAGS